MRKLLVIFLLFSLNAHSQIIRANNFYTPITTVSCAYDPDACAFFTAVTGGGDVLSADEKTVVDSSIKIFKAASMWNSTDLKVFYPFVGGTITSCKWNARDPRDLDAAFRITFGGTSTYSNGVAWNGTTGYGNTHLDASTNLTAGSCHLSYYTMTASTNGFDMGNLGSGIDNRTVMVINYFNVLYSEVYSYANAVVLGGQTAVAGFFVSNRTSATSLKVYRDNSEIGSNTTNETNVAPSGGLFIGAVNDGSGSPALNSDKKAGMITIGGGLDGTKLTALYNVQQLFKNILGR